MKQETPIQATPIPGFSSEVFSDEATKEKIRKHLSDINDVITEDDIKNVRTSMTVMPATEAESRCAREDQRQQRKLHPPLPS
ncbi:MAG: hypothetical protein EOO88_41185, partial [Pedobacter sp.]